MKKNKILVIDDSNSTRELIVDYLDHKGYKAIEAVDGNTGIKLFQSEKPDIILLDVVMPDLSGYEVAKKIRELEAVPNTSYIAPWTPIIFLTANAAQEGLQKAVLSGGDDYLVKPVPLPSIKSKIEVFIRILEAKTKYVEKYNELVEEKDKVSFSEMLLNKIFDTSPFGILCTYENGSVMMANKVISDMFGFNNHALLRKNIIDLLPKIYDIHESNGRRTLTTGKTLKLQAVNSNNTEFPVYVKIDSFSVRNKQHFVISIEDITSMQELSLRLEQTSKLEAMGNLAAGVAHDFNNILATSIGYSDLALEDAIDNKNKKLERYLTAIAKSHDRAKNLIQQMLDFGKAEHSNFKLIEINTTLKNIVEMLSEVIPSQIKINTDINNSPLYTIGTKHKLEQVIMNLIINAKDAIETEGDITVSLSCEENTDNKICTSCQESFSGDFAIISVKDSGDGIPENIIHNIFDPFFTTKGPAKGSGMGLAVVHGIAHSFKGHILIESEPNIGTNFKIYMPIYTKENYENVTHKIDEYNPFDPEALLGNQQRVCLIDDEKQILSYLSELLIKYNYNVLSFDSPLTFIDEFQTQELEPDLIISDLSMPTLTGIDIAKKVRELDYANKFILMSGYAQELDPKELKTHNICEFLNKPLNNRDILKKIKECFKS